jgi:hypothetical protein
MEESACGGESESVNPLGVRSNCRGPRVLPFQRLIEHEASEPARPRKGELVVPYELATGRINHDGRRRRSKYDETGQSIDQLETSSRGPNSLPEQNETRLPIKSYSMQLAMVVMSVPEESQHGTKVLAKILSADYRSMTFSAPKHNARSFPLYSR